MVVMVCVVLSCLDGDYYVEQVDDISFGGLFFSLIRVSIRLVFIHVCLFLVVGGLVSRWGEVGDSSMYPTLGWLDVTFLLGLFLPGGGVRWVLDLSSRSQGAWFASAFTRCENFYFFLWAFFVDDRHLLFITVISFCFLLFFLFG